MRQMLDATCHMLHVTQKACALLNVSCPHSCEDSKVERERGEDMEDAGLGGQACKQLARLLRQPLEPLDLLCLRLCHQDGRYVEALWVSSCLQVLSCVYLPPGGLAGLVVCLPAI